MVAVFVICGIWFLRLIDSGSVSGSLLLFIYIDELPAVVSSHYTNVNLFADDVLLYHQITDAMSYAVLQETTGTYQLPWESAEVCT